MPEFVDIHCHILPGLDDGARNWEETLAMARRAVADGIRQVIATPHQSEQYPQNTADRILSRTREAQERLEQAGIPLTVLPGADVRIMDSTITQVSRGDRLTLGNLGKHVLLELPADVALSLDELIYELELRGIRSVLSHPERNIVLQADPAPLQRLVEQGCLLQVTAGSFLGTFGRTARRTAFRLLRAGLVHIVASDAHNDADRPFALAAAYQVFVAAVGHDEADRSFCERPALVAQGEQFDPPLPKSSPRAQRTTLLAALFRRA